MERPFTALVNGVSVEAAGIAIGSDVPHTVLSEAPTLVVFIDELTPMSRCVKHTLLRGAPGGHGYVCFLRGRGAVAGCAHGGGCGRRRCRNRAAARIAGATYLCGGSADTGGGRLHESNPALEQLTIREVARAVHLSPSRLTHLFRRDTGISPHLYLANLKLERAFYLLETGRSLTRSAWMRALPLPPTWRTPAGSCTVCP